MPGARLREEPLLLGVSGVHLFLLLPPLGMLRLFPRHLLKCLLHAWQRRP